MVEQITRRWFVLASLQVVRSAGSQAEHLVSFCMQVLMLLNNAEKQLNVHVKVKHWEGWYAGFDSKVSLQCSECGDIGYKKIACPYKVQREGVCGSADKSNQMLFVT